MYQLIILKHEANENFEKELAVYKEKRAGDFYGNRDRDSQEPQPKKVTRSLDVVLNEEEFKALKAGTIKVFE